MIRGTNNVGTHEDVDVVAEEAGREERRRLGCRAGRIVGRSWSDADALQGHSVGKEGDSVAGLGRVGGVNDMRGVRGKTIQEEEKKASKSETYMIPLIEQYLNTQPAHN